MCKLMIALILLFGAGQAVAEEEIPQLMFDGSKESCEEAVRKCNKNDACIEKLAKQGCESEEPEEPSDFLKQFEDFKIPQS